MSRLGVIVAEFVTSWPRARKEHKCSDCGRTIRPGETYRRGVGFDGTAWSWKECQHCEYALNRYDLAWDGEYNADDFAEWASDGDCRDVQEARDMAGYRKRWTTAGGNLWPLPADVEVGRRD